MRKPEASNLQFVQRKAGLPAEPDLVEYAPFVNVYEDENSGGLHCRNSAGGQLG